MMEIHPKWGSGLVTVPGNTLNTKLEEQMLNTLAIISKTSFNKGAYYMKTIKCLGQRKINARYLGHRCKLY